MNWQSNWPDEGVRGSPRQGSGGWVVAAFAVCAALTAGCASKGGEPVADATPEAKAAAVKERASARWAALIKGDKDAAYAYLSPGVRKTMSLEQYRARTNTSGFRAAEIEKVDCEAEVCKVMLKLTYDYVPEKGVTAARGITTAAWETWVVEQGQAWFAMRP